MKQLIPPTSTIRSRMMKIMMMLPGVEQDESDDDDCSVSVLSKPGEASSSDIEDYCPNIIGDELLLDFGAKFQR